MYDADEAKKAPLLDLILFVEAEIEDIDIWETVLKREGKKLYERMAWRRELLKRVASALELMKTHEKDFGNLVRTKAKQQR